MKTTDFADLDHEGDLPFNLVCVNAPELPQFVAEAGRDRFKDRYTIGVWAWETDAIPASWDTAFGLVDEIWVYSRYVADLLGHAAPCPVVVKRAMIDWWGPILEEIYGGTENVGSAMISSEEWLRKPGSVGRVARGSLHICDDYGKELPAGETGTVYFDCGASFEYLNDPGKTAGARHPQHGAWSTFGDIGRVEIRLAGVQIDLGLRLELQQPLEAHGAGGCGRIVAGGDHPAARADLRLQPENIELIAGNLRNKSRLRKKLAAAIRGYRINSSHESNDLSSALQID